MANTLMMGRFGATLPRGIGISMATNGRLPSPIATAGAARNSVGARMDNPTRSVMTETPGQYADRMARVDDEMRRGVAAGYSPDQARNAAYGPHNIAGWDTSGVGPGTRGYRGSGRVDGYSANRQGGASDFIRRNGGLSTPRESLLNEHYLNQPGQTMGAWDRLQNQRKMDQSDPIGAFYADQAGVANGQREYDKADLFHGMLQDHLAQRQAAGTSTERSGGMLITHNADGSTTGVPDDGEGSGATQAGNAFSPGETRYDKGGNLWRYNQNSGHGDLIQRAPERHSWEQSAPTFTESYHARTPEQASEEMQLRRDAAAPQTSMEIGDNAGDATLHSQFGDVSVNEGQPGNATFTSGHGMNLGWGNMPGIYAGQTQSAPDFFQDAANRQGANRYAVPAPGYHGVKSDAWSAYGSAMKARNLLGKK